MMPLPIQITTWLSQEVVWRFVGFASTVVGFICYALSSSFNYLFGKWNLFKIILYCTFGLFICLWSLFAKVCQRSTSLRFKAHAAFLVLTITSVYSYFGDKAMNGKPDAYSLISCAAFAIMSMSLSLSRQTECGFEVDLLYFFLGCLIVQLMKIKLALAIVGVGFSYALIILRSSLDTTSYQNLAVQDDPSIVIDVNSLNIENGSMMQQLMACVKALRQGNSNVTNMLLDQTEKYMTLFKSEPEPEGIDHNFVIDALSLEKINDLHKTIKLMVDNGFEEECCEVYCNWRRESLEECLMGLFRMQELVHMELLEEYIIDRWIKVLKVALRILFPSEHRLSHVVFSGYSSVADLCFTEVCQGATIELLNMADAFASGSPSQWRLSKLIGMFVQLSDLIPEFQTLLPESLVKEVVTVQDKLGEASRDIFKKMENMIFRIPEVKAVAPADGNFHPITRYVKNYLVFACGEEHKLDQILRQYPAFINGVAVSSVSDQFDRIMKRLERKLVAMSKIYNNPSLRYFFLMNNWREIEEALRHDYFRKAMTKFQQSLDLYQRSSWNMVLDILKLENNEFVEPNANVQSMKDNLDLFNKHFEEICSTQSTWSASDEMLREYIISTLQNIVVPAYGIFIGRFQDILGNQNAAKYIKYGIFGVRDQLNDLFLGSMPMKLKQKERER